MKGKLTSKQIIHAISNGVIATDAAGNVVLINKAAEMIVGFDRERVVGASLLHLCPRLGDLVLECLETKESQLGRPITLQDRELMVNVSGIQEKNRFVGAVCNFEGMVEFEHTASELESYKQVNEQLNAIFNSTSDGIWVCDGQGKVLKINKASENLNNFKAKYFLGKNIKWLVTKGLIDRSATLEVLTSKRQVHIMQFVKDTKKHLLVTGTPVFDEDGNISLVVVNERDMTNLNSLREQLEQTRMITEKYKDELAELSMRELQKKQEIIASEEMKEVLRIALKLARLEASDILILGESGTGKGLLAKFIHENSKRRKRPFIQINCAALPESLLEAELFGYEKGAFTGAKEQGKVGLFELAHEGTLFLDEIGELSLSVQAKLLKYLDDQTVMRLGGSEPKKLDCIVIAATNRDLKKRIKNGTFRQDLYFRLEAFTIKIPPLRERPDDVFELINYYLGKYNARFKRKRHISAKTINKLLGYPFPGNVRQLKNALKMAVAISDKENIDDLILEKLESGIKPESDFDEHSNDNPGFNEKMFAFERKILERAIVKNQSIRQMARNLKISKSTLSRKMQRHGLTLNGPNLGQSMR